MTEFEKQIIEAKGEYDSWDCESPHFLEQVRTSPVTKLAVSCLVETVVVQEFR